MPDAAGKLFEFCSVNGEMDGWRQGRHFFTDFGGTNFFLSSSTQICKQKFHQSPRDLLNRAQVSFTKSVGYSTILLFFFFFFLFVLFLVWSAGFLFMYHTNSGSIHQTFKELSFPLSCALKVWFFKLPHPFLQVPHGPRWLDVAYGRWSLCSMEKWI